MTTEPGQWGFAAEERQSFFPIRKARMPSTHVIMEPETLEERIMLHALSGDKTKMKVELYAALTVVFTFFALLFASALAFNHMTVPLQQPWAITLWVLSVLWLTGAVLSAVNMFMYGLKWLVQAHWLQLLQMKLETEGNQPT